MLRDGWPEGLGGARATEPNTLASDGVTSSRPRPWRRRRRRRAWRLLLVGAPVALLALSAAWGVIGWVADDPGGDPVPVEVASDCGEVTHQALDVEFALPHRVDGRDLSVWSVAGTCWLWIATKEDWRYDELMSLVEEYEIDPADLRYAIAGRADVANDPPYFVFAISAPDDPDARDLAVPMLVAGAGFKNGDLPPLDEFTEERIAGHVVQVGTREMIDQSEHLRGLPYLIETPGLDIIVVTDERAWAIDAIAQLPTQ